MPRDFDRPLPGLVVSVLGPGILSKECLKPSRWAEVLRRAATLAEDDALQAAMLLP